MVNSSPRSKFLNKLVVSDDVRGVCSWMNWLLLIVFFLLIQLIFLNVFFFNLPPFLLGILLCYIVLLFSILPSTCLLSSLVLEFLSPFPQLSYFLGIKVAENTVRGLFHINAARKAAVMHLMRW